MRERGDEPVGKLELLPAKPAQRAKLKLHGLLSRELRLLSREEVLKRLMTAEVSFEHDVLV